MFCALLMSRYQVSVFRTNGPLVIFVLNANELMELVSYITT